MSECDICNELAEIKATLADHGDKLSLLLTGVGALVAALPPSFTVDAVVFDGTNDYLTRGAALTGVGDSGTAILSYWIRKTVAGNGGLLVNDSFQVGVEVANSNKPAFYDSTGTNGVDAFGATSVDDGSWHHVLMSITGPTLQFYVDGSLDGVTPSVNGTPSTFFFSDSNWAVGSYTDGTGKINAELAELYFAPGQYLDLSVTANREKFRSAAGKPVDLGSDGSTPTGSVPAIYLHIDDGEAAANFATNAGGGGNFTVTGTLTTASTSPSD